MRIAFIVYGPLDRRSGGFLYDDHLRIALERRGHRVTVISQREGALMLRIIRNTAVFTRLRRCFSSDSAAPGSPPSHRGALPDLVIADELNHPSLFAALPRIRAAGIPVAAVVHHLRSLENLRPLERRLTHAMERRFLDRADAFVFNSRHTAASVRRLLGREPIPAHIATPGADNPPADHSSAAPLRPASSEDAGPMPVGRKASGGMRVLFIGTLIRRKGLERLISALLNIESELWELDIAGDESADPVYADSCRVRCAAAMKNGRIRFHGRAADDRVQRLRSAGDVLAVPSDVEGFGIVYLEAMRAGMVPIAGSLGGAGEIIRDGIDGFLVPPSRPDILRGRLRRLALQPELRARMAAAARKRAEEFPSWEQSMEGAAVFIESIPGTHRMKPRRGNAQQCTTMRID